MSTPTDELVGIKPDRDPSFTPLGKDDESRISWYDKVKARANAGKKAVPSEPQAPREVPKKVSGKGRSNHEKRANKVTGVLSTMSLAVSVYGITRPHMSWVVQDGQRIKVPDNTYLLDAKSIMEAAPFVGEQWATWADENESVAKAIDAISSGSAGAAAIASLASIAIPILANHNKVPQEIAQRFAPAVLEKMLADAKEASEE